MFIAPSSISLLAPLGARRPLAIALLTERFIFGLAGSIDISLLTEQNHAP